MERELTSGTWDAGKMVVAIKKFRETVREIREGQRDRER